MADKNSESQVRETDIAIVGMAAHLPGAGTVQEYWANLRDGVESIVPLDEAMLDAAGESQARRRHKNYVPAAAILKDFEKFDAEFFGLSPKEAAIMDPQHRQFLEVSWEALENAGHVPENFAGPIGVFAGCGMGSYFYFNVCSNKSLVDNTGMFLLRHTGNDKDFLSTRLSHILDLKGPSLSLQTACSTSLVAAHYAAQALLNGECDMALAGGVTIELPHGRGYVFEEGEILSPDGHCHAFDHRAQGTVFGSGAGVVVLRRLEDAIADGDHIWAVIRGTAVNNDGAAKAGYLAPSVDGQAAAIADAHAMAEVSADSVDYVECHGTGTYLGDPIEVAALTEAFRETTDEVGFCRLGSVKTNIGHLDTAAGVASLIKTSMSLHHREMPPTLGYEKPNPAIDFDTSPFKVNDVLTPWISQNGPRRAGVNSLGVGGTNAHAILEEAPVLRASQEGDWPFHLLTLSGRNAKALDGNAANLAQHLRSHPGQLLEDVAYTLKEGRRAFEKRRVVVAETHEEAADLLDSDDPRRVFTHTAFEATPDVVFMFPGGGAQYVGMGRDLYETEPVFQEWMDGGLDILQAQIDYDIRAVWLAEGAEAEAAHERLKQPSVQLPLIMIVEYALAQQLISWGVTPSALVGHSMGENTAACLAGVMSFEDCIGLVLLRGQLFDSIAKGGMLSVPLSVADLTPFMGADLDIAGLNAPELTVVSGPQAALDALQARLQDKDIQAQRIAIDIAAHSAMLEPILGRFGDYLRNIDLHPPQLPIISNRTGQTLSDSDAVDPDYWVAHLRNTVRFADCISTLSQQRERVYLEVGPGVALSALTRMHGGVDNSAVINGLRHPDDTVADDVHFIGVLGRLWACGASFDWDQIWGDVPRQRVVLPSYAFQRSPYFIERAEASEEIAQAELSRLEDSADWGFAPVWRPRLAECDFDIDHDLGELPAQSWLIFMDQTGVGRALADRLRGVGHDVVEVTAGDAFARQEDGHYVLAPERGREGYDALISDLMARGQAPNRIVHMWLLTGDETFRPGSSFFHRNQEQGFYSLMFLGQAMGDANLPGPLHLTAVTTGAVETRREGQTYPEKSTALGPVQVMPREFPGLTCASIDIELPKGDVQGVVSRLLEDLSAEPANLQAAYRGEKRFEKTYRKADMAAAGKGESTQGSPVLRDGGTYMITGGFGGIGLTLAEKMIREAGANVVLLGRDALPARDSWPRYLLNHAPQDRMARRIRAVERLEKLGGKVLSLAADVCNVDDMQAAVLATNQRFGAIHGVIHAAGVIDDGPLLTKSSVGVDDVLAPKLHGTQVLDTVFGDGVLDWLVVFASSSTATAPAGQVDYVAANAYLNAYAQARRQDKTRVLAINWGLWSEVGMAADAVAERRGDHEGAPFVATDVPLLDDMGFDAAGARIFTASYDTASRWVLDQHRTGTNDAVMPGTGYLELMAEALQAQGEGDAFEIRDVMFLRAMHVEDGEQRNMQVRLLRSDEGYRFETRSACKVDGRDAWQLHAEARLLLRPQAAPDAVDIAALRTRLGQGEQAANGDSLRSPQEAHLKFGPHWQVLRNRSLGAGEGLADLSLDDGLMADGYQLHPGLMDLATGWAMNLIKGYEAGHLWVPISYERVQVCTPLPRQIVSWVRLASGDVESGVARFDVTLMRPDGTVCVEVQGLTIKQIDTVAGLAKPMPPRAAEVEFDQAGQGALPLSAAEERLAYNLSQGILPAEGARMFEMALRSDLPQVVISSLDLPALMAEADRGMLADEAQTAGFERPELDTDYVEPGNDIERTLAGFWQDLLGVSQVGVEDNFFDLGGHSLIAVRLFAMVKKAYLIEFPISVLFEAPTVAKCAALIGERIGPQADTSDSSDDGTAAPSRRYTHLVPMHSGAGGDKAPFFLVAGMFGNVLNLRHLAHLVGHDRPFYGLQARGLYGDAAPHDDMVEAAADYIDELRSVQPKGPYYLGGFSGGGITAYEIAHQLEAMGEEVALVVMLDTPLPVRRPLSRGDRLSIQWQEMKKAGLAYPLNWARNRIAWEIEKRRKPVETDEAAGPEFHNAEIEAAFLRAVAKYPLRGWQGRLVLFRPPLVAKWQVGGDRLVDHQRAYVFKDNDWRQWAPHLSVFEVPGDHDSMVLEPNVRVLAAQLKKVIAEAEAAEVVPFPGTKYAAE